MITTDCPLCDRPALLEADAIACDACGVVVEIAPDGPVELALAA